MKNLWTGVSWSGLNTSMPGASRYRDCPILTIECQVFFSPAAEGNSLSTCHTKIMIRRVILAESCLQS